MNKKRIMAILAAGVFSAVSVNPTAVMADSDTEPTTETGEMFYVDGDSTDGQMIVSEDGTPLQKTVKASEMGMSSEETLDFPFMGLSAELPDELKKQMDSADVVLLTDEDWTDDFDNIKYAHLFWSKLTDEQKEEEVDVYKRQPSAFTKTSSLPMRTAIWISPRFTASTSTSTKASPVTTTRAIVIS